MGIIPPRVLDVFLGFRGEVAGIGKLGKEEGWTGSNNMVVIVEGDMTGNERWSDAKKKNQDRHTDVPLSNLLYSHI